MELLPGTLPGARREGQLSLRASPIKPTLPLHVHVNRRGRHVGAFRPVKAPRGACPAPSPCGPCERPQPAVPRQLTGTPPGRGARALRSAQLASKFEDRRARPARPVSSPPERRRLARPGRASRTCRDCLASARAASSRERRRDGENPFSESRGARPVAPASVAALERVARRDAGRARTPEDPRGAEPGASARRGEKNPFSRRGEVRRAPRFAAPRPAARDSSRDSRAAPAGRARTPEDLRELAGFGGRKGRSARRCETPTLSSCRRSRRSPADGPPP